jgi:hypothetical protein
MTSQTTNPLYGNFVSVRMYKNTTYAGTTSSATSFNATITLPGVKVGSHVQVLAPSAAPVTGVCIGSAYVATAGNITVQFMNTTGGSVTTTAATAAAPYRILVWHLDGNSPGDLSASMA